MKYLITKDEIDGGRNNENNYSEIHFEDLKKLCEDKNITDYFGRGFQRMPDGELFSSTDKTFTINLIYEDVVELRVVESKLKKIVSRRIPSMLLYEQSSDKHKKTSINMNNNMKEVLKILKNKIGSSSYQDVIIELIYKAYYE